MTVDKHGQIPCPSCGQPLVLPVEAVLAAQPIVCSACGLEMTTEREVSHKALNALSRWYQGTQAARSTVGSGSGSPATDGAGRQPRRRHR